MTSVCQQSMRVYQIKLFILSVLGLNLIIIEPLHSQNKSSDEVGKLYELAASAVAASDSRTVLGHNEKWLFLRNELIHVSKGNFWEKDWSKIAVSGKDPLDIFLSFKKKLGALGVEFIFVPIPSKVNIYPEKFSDSVSMDGVLPLSNAQHQIKSYFDKFREAGINVIDIEPTLKARRPAESVTSYCLSDSHPSPMTCQLIADSLAKKINSYKWAKKYAEDSDVSFIKRDPKMIEVVGDLVPEDKRETWSPEKLMISKVYSKINGELKPLIPDNESSPVIVMGDSHTLIFHEGEDMHASGAGLVDHLQEKVGFKVFLAASRGSSSQALRQIYKGKEFWEGKKMLIWVSSVREFTEERRWLQLPRLPR